ncbi:GPI-anchor transamidase subunit gab1 [Sparganum proliferum]
MLCSSTKVVNAKPCEARKDIIISGYLMKSPPPPAKKSKSVSPLLCLSLAAHPQQNWKKRFCVLYKLRKPGQTEVYLHYFKDRDCKHFKGSVDLQSCHCIYEELETLNRQNIFGIKTMWMGEARTYLFSAETPEEMDQWLYRLGAALHMDTAVPEVLGIWNGGGKATFADLELSIKKRLKQSLETVKKVQMINDNAQASDPTPGSSTGSSTNPTMDSPNMD